MVAQIKPYRLTTTCMEADYTHTLSCGGVVLLHVAQRVGESKKEFLKIKRGGERIK